MKNRNTPQGAMPDDPFLQRMKNQPEWWDSYSCQPYTMPAEEKPRSGWRNILEYGKIAATNLVGLPFIAAQYLRLKPKPSDIDAKEFVGVSIEPDYVYIDEIEAMLYELGVQQIMLRIPSWDSENLEHYTRFIQRFAAYNITINILQSRDSVQQPEQWQQQVRAIIYACWPFTHTFWIGNAVNRTKWGCAHTGDYLRLQEKVEVLRAEFDGIRLLGSSIIDFEPLLSWRTLFNARQYRLDGNAALLYVNRRHSPYGTQYGVFDLQNKLRLAKAMTQLSNRCQDRLWIAETNWPLLDTKPYTPNSGNPTRTVDEQTQAEYLKLYYQIAWQSGWVEKVFWWQLINPGYGLVDHREGNLRKMPSFYALKDILAGELLNQPSK